jgi:hypothetical protein
MDFFKNLWKRVKSVDLVNFSRTTKYKIVLGCLGVFGLMFIIIGAISIDTTPDPRPQGMVLTASNLAAVVSDDYDYTLEILGVRTPLAVDTAPNNQTRNPVIITITGSENFASVMPNGETVGGPTATIATGGVAIIQLNRVGSLYAFGSSFEIRIDCGGQSRRILATIAVPNQSNKQHVDFSTGVQERSWAGNWFYVGDISARLYQQDPNAFRVIPHLVIWGSAITENVTYSVSGVGSVRNIRLFNTNGPEIFIPSNLIAEMIDNPEREVSVTFRITARFQYGLGEFDFQDYIDLITITIVH